MNKLIKNKESHFKGYTENVFPLLRKIPNYELNSLFKQYKVYCKKNIMIQGITLAFAAIAVVHNFLIFSGAYSNNYDEQSIMKGLLVLFLIPCFLVIIVLLKEQFKLRVLLKKMCLAYNLPVKKIRKEFNQYVKMHIGGFGV